MTIVEMVSWQRGTFTLDVDVIDINDEYRYIPENLHQELNFDTQMVLLDALRIYDEKRADGSISPDFSNPDVMTKAIVQNAEPQLEPEPVFCEPERNLSADMLGLDSFDEIEVAIPEVFTSLEAFDPSEIQRQKVRELLPDYPAVQREALITYLTDKTCILGNQENIEHQLNETIILYGSDELVLHGLMSTCKYEGIMVFSAADEAELENKIGQSFEHDLRPVLVFDCPRAAVENSTYDEMTRLRQKMSGLFPQLQTVQVTAPTDYIYALQALTTGADVCIPRPTADNLQELFIPEFIQFLDSFPCFIHGLCHRQPLANIPKAEFLKQLRRMASASEVFFFLLEQTSQFFDRCLTFVLHKGELVAERSFGIETDKSAGPSKPLRFKVEVAPEGFLDTVIKEGKLFFSAVEDQTIRESIFGEICAPDKSKILLMPLVAAGRTLGLIYADFGQSKSKTIDRDYLESLSWVAGITLDKLIRNKR
jgi:hypothetical protein